ncbi:hypothetical protein FZEAL_7315 [Fusarium zealandicum]|uniref:DNA (cytosine-5-)-methyltransferase n=1 Tax=Fusarium zealandicum TaxID=1053134 RepID=A0A8H4UGT1_9HYPO|nr:hypothetical protein FZEAL_7315 [Fusarium zealandicum]
MPIQYIDLDEDDVCFLTEGPSKSHERTRCSSSCTLSDDSRPDLECFGSIAEEVIDLTFDLGASGHSLLNDGEFTLATTYISDFLIQPGTFLKVREFQAGDYLAELVLVKIVVRCQSSGNVKIRGTPFVRACSALGKFPKKSNEVCMLVCYNVDNASRSEELVEIDPSCVKLEVCFTGQGSRKKQCEESLVRLQPDEVLETQYRVSEDTLSNRWRGTRVKGGSWVPNGCAQEDSIDLESTGVSHNKTRSYGQQYTMFDSCSGAGGVSRGAQMAGFKVQYAVDKAPEVWPTYETNFPSTELFKMPLDELLSSPWIGHMRVDVLHFSPPCQFFSPAHTHESAHDDENIFALYGCNQLLKKLRPRIITVEQTFGITQDRHAEYFYPFLGDFTQFGYSVKWKIVKLCTWGAAQDRKRLIIIAAAPGERLPPFPQATHSVNGQGGLLPFNTISKAIRGIRQGDDLHDLHNVKYHQPRRAPYDGNRLAGTITTRGGDFYYPDGTRNLTLREFASLQGFPKTHRFLGTMTSIKRQIGNAFPPNTVCVLYKHIEKWLLKQDGVLPYDPRDDSILIDDDSDQSVNLAVDMEEDARHSPDMMEDDFVEVVEEAQHRLPRANWQIEDAVIDLT